VSEFNENFRSHLKKGHHFMFQSHRESTFNFSEGLGQLWRIAMYMNTEY